MNKTEQIKNDLKNAITLEDFFNVVKKHYDCEGCTLATGAKTSLMLYLPNLLTLTGVKIKP
jgi:hypothetical protein